MGPMSTVITYAGGTITPEVVNGFESSRETNTIVHNILGRSDPDITYRPAGLQSGRLTLVFASGAAARAAEAALVVVPRSFQLSDPDAPSAGMRFVVAGGEVNIRFDLDTQTVWLVEIPFQEIPT